MFGFENDKMLTATIDETAMEEKWTLPTAAIKPPKGDSFYECIAGLLIQS